MSDMKELLYTGKAKDVYKTDNDDEERVEIPQAIDKQTSPVFVTPDTLPNKVDEEKVEATEMPNLIDIPVPQPIRVVQSSQVIDSSKKENISLNEIENEEYSIKR